MEKKKVIVCETVLSIIFVGLPGAGKTTIGRQLARRLGVSFVDSDHVIEERLGCSIREYFAREGEEAFRDVEQAVLDDLSLHHHGVLSTGGGSVLREANRRHMHERGYVIYLRTSPEDVYRRVRHDTGRPLLQVDDPLARSALDHPHRCKFSTCACLRAVPWWCERSSVR